MSDRCEVCGQRMRTWRPPLAFTACPPGWMCGSDLIELEQYRGSRDPIIAQLMADEPAPAFVVEPEPQLFDPNAAPGE